MKTVLTGWFGGLRIPRLRGRLKLDERVKSLTYALVKAERERDWLKRELDAALQQSELAYQRAREAEEKAAAEIIARDAALDALNEMRRAKIMDIQDLLGEELFLDKYSLPVAMSKAELIEQILTMLKEV